MKHLPTITIKSIPHKQQRYETCGDYFKYKDTLQFRVSKTNADMEFLVVIHELIEAYLTQRKGIKISDIDKFDMAFEKNRKPGNTDEPGNDKNAPYYAEHQFATLIEKTLAKKLKVNWAKYGKIINEL